MSSLRPVRTLTARLWAASAPLTTTAGVMLVALLVFAAALALDPRTITGVPAWLKPAKFAISTAIYSVTLAWMMTYLPEWRRMRAVVGWTTAAVFVVEVAIIAMQAWRGTTSHFNVATTFDAVLFGVMGSAIVVQTLFAAAAALALWRHRFEDRVLGLAMRLGLTIALAGASIGGMMTRPTDAQLAEARAGARMTISGAHTVGAPDGGPGLPGTGWSTDHGDVRVPHFVGLHAMQALPLLALALGRTRLSPARRSRLIVIAAASYSTFFALLLWQAVRAQSILRPDRDTLLALGLWALVTVLAMALAGRRSPRGADLTREGWVGL
jgi:hypothetical protein